VDGEGRYAYWDTRLKIEGVEPHHNSSYTCTLTFTLGGANGSVSETIEASVSGEGGALHSEATVNKTRRGHTEVTQRSCRGHTKVTQRSRRGHTKVTQRSCRGHTKVTQRSHRGHAEVTQRSRIGHTEVTQRSRRGHTKVTQRSRRGHAVTTHSQCIPESLPDGLSPCLLVSLSSEKYSLTPQIHEPANQRLPALPGELHLFRLHMFMSWS